MKPWAKLELGHLMHPKFLALTARAICLWHEGKNYADTQQTDGVIPKNALKSFRFLDRKSLQLLLTSCGEKPDGTPYAPLWEPYESGYRMHDYLDHNDGRSAVLARIKQADETRRVDRERLRRWREKRRRAAAETAFPNADETLSTETETETPTESEVRTTVQNTVVRPTAESAVGTARTTPLVARRRLDAVFEFGRLYVPLRAHTDLLKIHPDEPALLAFYLEIAEAWTTGAHATDNPGADMITFWKRQHDLRWPPTAPLRVPFSTRVPPAAEPWSCPHVERCASRGACGNATFLGRPERATVSA